MLYVHTSGKRLLSGTESKRGAPAAAAAAAARERQLAKALIPVRLRPSVS
ncbi:hypothetical protein GCM10009689_15090 [Brevibacterium antiquum]